MAVSGEGWFPTGQNDGAGWRLDIVSLLAVIGESSMAEHAQTLTASWMCCLPRIIPAPQVLLKPNRPSRMPQFPAIVVGVKSGILVQSLNYFPNIIHPLEDLKPFEFRVYHIRHKPQTLAAIRQNSMKRRSTFGRSPDRVAQGAIAGNELRPRMAAKSSGLSISMPRSEETNGSTVHGASDPDPEPEIKLPPHVPSKTFSPLNILSLLSCALTVGLFIMAAIDNDGVACLALVTISLASSIVGYASLWSPRLMKRIAEVEVPAGDVVIRTREGAFVVVKCDEDVARELYTGTEECCYTIMNSHVYRGLVAAGTFFLMVSVVLLGNCNFPQQAAIGASYIFLNGAYWGAALFRKDRFWNLELYDVTPLHLKNINDRMMAKASKAHLDNAPLSTNVEEKPSFTRTMWYAIRETAEVGWVKRSQAAPTTDEWDEWLKAAKLAATDQTLRETWPAVSEKNRLVGQTEADATRSPISPATQDAIKVPGGQQAPELEVQPRERV